MFFDELIGLKERTNQELIFREAVRAICFREDKILMIESNQGDFKLPGGGIERYESHEQALIREVAEETGYECKRMSHLVGKVLERKKDIFEEDKLFEMISYYYLCEVGDEKGEQQLDDYEIELGFKPVWIDINEAIKKNEAFQKSLDNDDIWTQRENFILAKIEEIGKRTLMEVYK